MKALLAIGTLSTLIISSIVCVSDNWSDEFDCGLNYYRAYHVDEKRNALYVGGMDRLYRLPLNNIGKSDCEKDMITIPATNQDNCYSRGKSYPYQCRNHIRTIQPIGDGSRMYICGTNAYSSKDWIVHTNNMTYVALQEYIPGLGASISKCSYDPNLESTALLINRGVNNLYPALYAGTFTDYITGDPVIFREAIFDSQSNFHKRTVKFETKYLDNPSFVGSYEIGPYVYFFFRENAMEFMNCEKCMFSRVARICKQDNGGRHMMVHNWVTYLKARLNCSRPGDYPFYYNEIQSIYKTPDDDKFYATFITATAEVHSRVVRSAICIFTNEAIERAFSGKFKEQASSSSAWLPVMSSKVPEPRGGVCVNDTTSLPDTVVNFVRLHPLMDEAVLSKDGKPIFEYDGRKKGVYFVRNAVDMVRYDIYGKVYQYVVHFVGTSEGTVHKISQWYDEKGEARSALVDIIDVSPGHAITFIEVLHSRKALYVASDRNVKQFHLKKMCRARYEVCSLCVRDPHCGWDKDLNACDAFQLGLLQDVSNSSYSMCDSSIRRKNINAKYGESFRLKCFKHWPDALRHQVPVWFHYHKEKGRYVIEDMKKPDKYAAIPKDGSMFIMNMTSDDAGQYECSVGGATLCILHIKIKQHECGVPTKAEYRKIYSEYCKESRKYSLAMKMWSNTEKDFAQKCFPDEYNQTLAA